MIDYSILKNDRLRKLVSASESIKSLPENQVQGMVSQIALLSEPNVNALIEALEKEQLKIQAAKLAKGITLESEDEELDGKIRAVMTIKRNLDTGARVENEKVDQDATLVAAESLLKNLIKI